MREAIDAYDAAATDANARNSTIGFPIFEELNASLVGLDYVLIRSIRDDVELARRLFSYVALLEAASHRAATHALVAASGDGSSSASTGSSRSSSSPGRRRPRSRSSAPPRPTRRTSPSSTRP
ncbi:MAG: hypothetical protein R3C15_15055 [Thermoleophilia bacterium]